MPSTIHLGSRGSHSAQRIETVSIHSPAYFTRPITRPSTGSLSSHGTVLGRVDSLGRVLVTCKQGINVYVILVSNQLSH